MSGVFTSGGLSPLDTRTLSRYSTSSLSASSLSCSSETCCNKYEATMAHPRQDIDSFLDSEDITVSEKAYSMRPG